MTVINVLRWVVALTIFAALAYLPWHYWGIAGSVMNKQLPEGTWGMRLDDAKTIWWLMGYGLVVWVPMALAVAAFFSGLFMYATRTTPIPNADEMAQISLRNRRMGRRA